MKMISYNLCATREIVKTWADWIIISKDRAVWEVIITERKYTAIADLWGQGKELEVVKLIIMKSSLRVITTIQEWSIAMKFTERITMMKSKNPKLSWMKIIITIILHTHKTIEEAQSLQVEDMYKEVKKEES